MFESAKSFFETFSHDYLAKEKDKYLFQVKYNHTYQVVEYTKELVESLGWDSKKQSLHLRLLFFMI